MNRFRHWASVAAVCISVAFVLPLTDSASAASADLDTAVFRAFMDASSLNQVKASERQKIVDAMAAYWSDLDAKLPRLSPADLAWVEQEMNTSDSQRISRILRSPQYALYHLDTHVDICTGILENMTRNVGRDQATEVYFWLKAMQCYTDGDFERNVTASGLDFRTSSFPIAVRMIPGKIANSVMAGLQ